jgi:predicted RNA-binding protein with RPS1 domain
VLKEDAEVDARLLRVDAETGRVEASMLAFKTPEEQEDADALELLARMKEKEALENQTENGGKSALAAALEKAMREAK